MTYEYDEFYEAWFVYDENGEPLSRVFDTEDEAKAWINEKR